MKETVFKEKIQEVEIWIKISNPVFVNVFPVCELFPFYGTINGRTFDKEKFVLKNKSFDGKDVRWS